MQRNLDFLDLEILEGIGIYGPRNISTVARSLGMPEATVRRRLKQMLSQIFLLTNVYHTNIGLRKTIVLAKAPQGREKLLYNCMNTHDYLIYISRCFGAYEGCAAIYAVPIERCQEFELFLERLEEEGVAEKIRHFWSTCFHTVNLKCDWYDRDLERWNFPWEEWVHEVQAEGTELPFTLKDPAEYPMKADWADIFILKELETDATVSLKALADKLKITVPLVKYHFDKHIINRQMLEGFQVIYYPFDKANSNGFFFLFTFENLEKMAKFARSLLDKPFALSLGKIFGAPALFAYIYLPLAELRKFIDSLGELIRMGSLTSYEYVFQDAQTSQRYTIPYRSFKNETWQYDQERYLKEIDELVRAEKAGVEKKESKVALRVTS
jgi:DNA-binding Lrp family transcriptional regulator